MAAPAYVNASTGASDTTGAWTATCHAPGAAGRIIILHVIQDGATDGSTTFTSATNIENLAGTDNQMTAIGEFQVGNAESARHYLWIGRSLSTSAPTFTGGSSSGEDLFWRFYEFSGVNAGTTLADVIENSTAGTATGAFATSASVADVAVTTLGSDRLALNFIACDDDAQAAQLTAMTGETGGDWAYPVAAYGDSAGTDATLALVTATISSAGTIDGGTDAITSTGWGVVGFALKPADPTFSQTEAAFYEDGTESGSSVIDSGADSITRDVSGGDSNLQLRVRLQETNAVPGLSTDDYQLQYEKNDSGTYYNVDDGPTPSLLDSYSETNQSTGASVNNAGVSRIGQSFTGNGAYVDSATFSAQRVGSPTGNITATIYAHTGTFGTTGLPTGSALATSEPIDITTVDNTAFELLTFQFTGANRIVLTNAVNYFVVLENPNGDASNRLAVSIDLIGPTHAGNRANYTSPTWATSGTADLCFYIYTSTASVRSFNSASLTDGNATTNRLGSGTGSFVAGEISEDGLVDNLQITASNYTELLFSGTIVASAVADGDTIDFRWLRNGATTGMTYTVTPRITIDTGGGAPATRRYTLTTLGVG